MMKMEVPVKDTLFVTVTKKGGKLLTDKQARVALEKDKVLNSINEKVQRLVIFPSRFSHSKKLDVILTKETFCGMINGSEYRRNIFSSSYCPTLTIVTVDVSIILAFAKHEEQKRKRKFNKWSEEIRKELKFTGYWPVQEVNHGNENMMLAGSTGALLCATQSKLSILTRNSEGIYINRKQFDLDKMERWEKCTRGDSVLLNITFSNSSLNFKIKNDLGITRDLFQQLDKNSKKNSQTENKPVAMRQNPSKGRPKSGINRYSKDDMDIRPLLPRRKIFPVYPRNIQVYDLNAISKQNSVQDAIHFYENEQFYLERNPPDVVRQPPSAETEEIYWSIVNTLTEVLRRNAPKPDTLNLPCKLRRKLCFSLLDSNIPSWKELADYIGLTQEAVRMTETLFQSGIYLNPANGNDVLTPPECILRHWQFAHNEHMQGGLSQAPPYPCNMASLVQILEDMGRYDLVSLLNHQSPAPSPCPPPPPLYARI